MPFITEELWTVTAEQGRSAPQLLALTEWPERSMGLRTMPPKPKSAG